MRISRFWNGASGSGSRPWSWCAHRQPAKPGERAREARRRQGGHACACEPVRLGRPLVVAQRHERASGAAVADALHEEQARREHRLDHVVERRGRRDVDAGRTAAVERCGRRAPSEKYVGFRKYDVVANENASVGDGEIEAAAAQRRQPDERGDHGHRTAKLMTKARLRSRCQSSVALAPTAAPMAKNAIWPSDTCPAQPVSTTTERPSIVYTPTVANL